MKQRFSLGLSAAAFVLAVLALTPLGQAAGSAANDTLALATAQAKAPLQALGIVKRGPRGPRGYRGRRGPRGLRGPQGVQGAQGAPGGQGPAGTVGSLDDLSGKPCTIKGQPGVLVFGKPDAKQGFSVNISCLRADEWEPNNTQALAYDATPVYVASCATCNVNFNLQMSIYPAGDVDWIKLVAKPVTQGSVSGVAGATLAKMNVYKDGSQVASNITAFDNTNANWISTGSSDVHNWLFEVFQPANQLTTDRLNVCCGN